MTESPARRAILNEIRASDGAFLRGVAGARWTVSVRVRAALLLVGCPRCELESDVVGDAAVDVLTATQIRGFGLHADDYASVLRHSQRWNYGRGICIDSLTPRKFLFIKTQV